MKIAKEINSISLKKSTVTKNLELSENFAKFVYNQKLAHLKKIKIKKNPLLQKT